MAGLVLTFYLSVCSSCTYCSKKYRKMKPHRNKHLYYLIYIKKNSLKSMPLNISTYEKKIITIYDYLLFIYVSI